MLLFSPFGIFLNLLACVLSVGILAGGLYIVYGLVVGIFAGFAMLAAGVGMVLFSLLGRPLMLLLLGRPGGEAPDMRRDGLAMQTPGHSGSNLRVESYGPEGAPRLVLTHGWGMNSTSWSYLKRHLPPRFGLTVWDLPGLGESSPPRGDDYDLERLAADLQCVVNQEQHEVVLVGHSIGGMVILTFCRLFPEMLGSKVRGIVLANTTYTNPVRTAAFSGLLTALQKPLIEPLMHLIIWTSPLVWLTNWLAYLNGTAHLVSRFTGFAGAQTRSQLDFATRYQPLASPAVLARGMLAMLRYDARDVLAQLRVPVLLVAGSDDRATVKEASEYMQQEMRTANLTVLEPSGHMSYLEQNAAFEQALSEFAAACLAPEERRRDRLAS